MTRAAAVASEGLEAAGNVALLRQLNVGLGGASLCIYGMEGPGGYQFVGRTVQVWDQHQRGPRFERPWILRTFDQLRWHPVGAEELLEMRDAHAAGNPPIKVEETTFSLVELETGTRRRRWRPPPIPAPCSRRHSGPSGRPRRAGEFERQGG